LKRRRHIHRHKNSPFKQGTYKPVNRDKYAGCKNPEYRSSWELKFFQWCDKNTNVLEWSSESVVVPYRSPVDGRYHRYYVDNAVALKEGNDIKRYLVEIKPYKQTIPPTQSKRKKQSTILYEKTTFAVNQSKWEAAKKFASQRNMEFIILTENELGLK
tara:strand:- start:233 stop:706 length:474 start_codon:yes stop_codon:yes gene_type:complete